MTVTTLKDRPDIVKGLSEKELLDYVYDAHEQAIRRKTADAIDTYNWWAAVYNFRRGKHVVNYRGAPLAAPRPEKLRSIFEHTRPPKNPQGRPRKSERPAGIRFERSYGELLQR